LSNPARLSQVGARVHKQLAICRSIHAGMMAQLVESVPHHIPRWKVLKKTFGW
jgi:hypothetical protein